jgi:hypothetical protein
MQAIINAVDGTKSCECICKVRWTNNLLILFNKLLLSLSAERRIWRDFTSNVFEFEKPILQNAIIGSMTLKSWFALVDIKYVASNISVATGISDDREKIVYSPHFSMKIGPNERYIRTMLDLTNDKSLLKRILKIIDAVQLFWTFRAR